MKKNQKLIDMNKYTKIMNQIIEKGYSVEDTLIEMLETTSQYKIKENKNER